MGHFSNLETVYHTVSWYVAFLKNLQIMFRVFTLENYLLSLNGKEYLNQIWSILYEYTLSYYGIWFGIIEFSFKA